MIVLDASATVEWMFNQMASLPEVDRLLATRQIFVPAHWPIEIGHASLKALRRTAVEHDRIIESTVILANLAITIEPPTGIEEILVLLEFARLHGLTMYDAAYVHLALKREADLITFDIAMRNAAVRLGISVVPAA